MGFFAHSSLPFSLNLMLGLLLQHLFVSCHRANDNQQRLLVSGQVSGQLKWLHVNKTRLLLSVARLNPVLFGSVAVCSQAALFPVLEFFFSDQNARLGVSPVRFIGRLSPLLVLFYGSFPWTVHLAVYSSELKAGKHFQIKLHGCNQCSGDRWRAWTRPAREQRDLRWCPRGQTHDSHKGLSPMIRMRS